MNWYYLRDGQQVGPVDEAQFSALVQNQTVTPQTFVWREGMANWEPYANVSQASQPPIVPLGPGVVCSECGRVFPPDDVISLEGKFVCAQCKPIAIQKLREGVLIRGTLNYAGFWIRFAAKFLDGLILGVPMLVLMFMYVLNRPSPEAPPDVFGAVFQLAFYAAACAYNTFFLGKYGATPGKMACGLRVVTATGDSISFFRAFGRYFAEMLSGLICYIGYIIAGFDEQKRTLHDHICNTRVVRK